MKFTSFASKHSHACPECLKIVRWAKFWMFKTRSYSIKLVNVHDKSVHVCKPVIKALSYYQEF